MASTQVMADQTTSPQALASRLRDYYTLTKPEVNLLILMTTSAGYYLGSQGGFRIGRLVSTLIGTLLVASGTATLNQFMERRYDAQMRRTANRPLVSGRLSAREAFWFGILLSVAGGLYLALAVNTLAALLAVSTLLSYLLVYTPLKRKTPLCTALGAIPGAMPTLIDRKSTRLNSSHRTISYAVFCLKKKTSLCEVHGGHSHVAVAKRGGERAARLFASPRDVEPH